MPPKSEKTASEIRPRPPNPDDQWLDALRESCARTMANHLKHAVNTQREIRSLTLPEMMALAEACTAHWIVEVSKRMNEPYMREYKDLLLGA